MVGALPRWLSDEERLEALEAYERDALAASTREAVQAKLRTVHRALALWNLQPFPPTASALRALGATLKFGGYRSAASYLYLYKVEAQRLGFQWPDFLQRMLKDGVRSCERGLGPSTVAQPLRSTSSAGYRRGWRHGSGTDQHARAMPSLWVHGGLRGRSSFQH